MESQRYYELGDSGFYICPQESEEDAYRAGLPRKRAYRPDGLVQKPEGDSYHLELFEEKQKQLDIKHPKPE